MDPAAVECLLLASHFEKLWILYRQSGPYEVSYEGCRAEGRRFLDSLEKLLAARPSLHDQIANVIALDIAPDLDVVLTSLRAWVSAPDGYPHVDMDCSLWDMLWVLLAVKSELVAELDLEQRPTYSVPNVAGFFSEEAAPWKGHLRPELVNRGDSIMQAASQCPSFVVVADIRHSQDLMTYAVSPDDFRQRMGAFIGKAQEQVWKYHGVFDKFTGDGYLAYFNEEVSNRSKSRIKARTAFLEFVQSQQEFAGQHFGDWLKNVRKLPSGPIGLAIGADYGRIDFRLRTYHLLAVGDAIVWATRMASAAKAGQVVVNNLLYEQLRDLDEYLAFKDVKDKTKTGEPFLAHSMTFTPAAVAEHHVLDSALDDS